MPLADVEELDAGSSSVFDQDDAGKVAAEAAAVAAPAESSAATDETAEKDTLSVVRDVVNEKKSEAAAASSAEGEEAGKEPGATVTRKEPDDENYSDVPFHKHPRFQQVLGRMKGAEADAVRYRNVESFMEEHGLAADEAAEALMVAGLAKVNPAEAWKRMKSWVQQVLVAAGETLPEDLQKRVEAGELSNEAAQEVSRARATVQSVEARQTLEQRRTETRQETERRTAITGAAASWEQDRRAKDPNFNAKFVSLQKEVAFLQLSEGKPNNPDGVKDQLNRAYKAVNEQIRAAAPVPRQRPAVTPIRSGEVAGNARPESVSTLDVIRAHRRSA